MPHIHTSRLVRPSRKEPFPRMRHPEKPSPRYCTQAPPLHAKPPITSFEYHDCEQGKSVINRGKKVGTGATRERKIQQRKQKWGNIHHIETHTRRIGTGKLHSSYRIKNQLVHRCKTAESLVKRPRVPGWAGRGATRPERRGRFPSPKPTVVRL